MQLCGMCCTRCGARFRPRFWYLLLRFIVSWPWTASISFIIQSYHCVSSLPAMVKPFPAFCVHLRCAVIRANRASLQDSGKPMSRRAIACVYSKPRCFWKYFWWYSSASYQVASSNGSTLVIIFWPRRVCSADSDLRAAASISGVATNIADIYWGLLDPHGL